MCLFKVLPGEEVYTVCFFNYYLFDCWFLASLKQQIWNCQLKKSALEIVPTTLLKMFPTEKEEMKVLFVVG